MLRGWSPLQKTKLEWIESTRHPIQGSLSFQWQHDTRSVYVLSSVVNEISNTLTMMIMMMNIHCGIWAELARFNFRFWKL
jgi:hypothetical protein